MKTPNVHYELPARAFATAWLNAWLATSDDETRRVLYRTVMLETLTAGVRLWATDSYVLLRSAVDTDGGEPGDDETGPTIVAMDPDQRAKALMAFIMKDTKDGSNIDLTSTITVSTADSETGGATLAPELVRRAVVLDYKAERLALDVFEAEPPNWRTIRNQQEATDRLGLTEVTMKPLAALRSADARHGAVALALGGERGAIAVECPTYPRVRGIVMPASIGDEGE